MTKHILIIDDVHPVMLQKFSEAGFSVDHNETYTKEEVFERIPKAHAVVIRSKIIADTTFINAGKNLECIGRVGSGMETIDIAYAESKGITCLNSPEGNRDAVAEQVLGMLLSLTNNLYKAHTEVRNSIWDREGNRGWEIMGKTIGIIGYGNVGSSLARKLSGFDVRILAYDKFKKGFGNSSVEECSLEDIQKHADVISFHVPQTTETEYMCNKAFIQKLAKPCVIINTSRGKVVDTSAIAEGLQNNTLRAAALDVLEYESFNFEDFLSDRMPEAFEYLRTSPRVILTPHVAGWTVESKEKLSSVLADKIITCLSASSKQ